MDDRKLATLWLFEKIAASGIIKFLMKELVNKGS